MSRIRTRRLETFAVGRRVASGLRTHAGVVVGVWAGLGAGIGVVAAVVVRIGPNWAAALAHYAVPYVALLVLIALSSPRASAAALRAASCFVGFVVTYYVVVAVQFGAIPIVYATAWLVAALTVCPAAAAVIRWASTRPGRPRVVPVVVAATTGAVAVSDGSVGNVVRLTLGRIDPEFFNPVLFVTGCAGLLVAIGATILIPRDRTERLAALVLLLPFGAAATYIGWAVHFGVGPYL